MEKHQSFADFVRSNIRHVAVGHFLDRIGMRSIDLILIDFISMRYLIFDLKDQHQQVSIYIYIYDGHRE